VSFFLARKRESAKGTMEHQNMGAAAQLRRAAARHPGDGQQVQRLIAPSLSRFRAFAFSCEKRGAGRQPRLPLPALALALLLLPLAGCKRAADKPDDTVMMAPAEHTLREAAERRPAAAAAQRALGAYLLEQHRPYEAMWAFQDALDLNPQDAEARRGVARALVAAQLPRRALDILTPSAVSSSSQPAASAASTLPAAASSPGEDVEDRRAIAAAYLAMGDAQSAVTVLKAAGSALESSPAALFDLGNAEEALGDDEAAVSAYRRQLQLAATRGTATPEGELALARVTTRQQRWQEAFAALERAGKAAPDDPRALYLLGRAVQARGVPVAQSAGAPGTSLGFRIGKASGISPQSKIQNPKSATDRTAIRIFRQVLQSHPGYGPAHLQIGLWLLQHGQPGAAAESLERALTAGAGGEETRLHLAAALERAGARSAGPVPGAQWAGGQKSASARTAGARSQRALYFEAIQQPHQAVREYQRLMALDPARKDTPLLLSRAYDQMGMKAQALEPLRQGLERHPGNPSFMARLATLLIATDNQAAAAELCRRWLERQPDAADPYRLLGQIEREALRYGQAVQFDNQATAHDPRNAENWRETARALIGAPTPANLHQASVALRKAIALDPDDAETHLRLGEVLERLGDPEGARRQYQRCMDHEPGTRFGAYFLCQLCPRLGKKARARFYADNVRMLRRREDAARALWPLVYRNPHDADAHARLAAMFLEAGDTLHARYQLEQTVRLHPDRRKEALQLRMLERLQAIGER
jgi:tetratricopeptide (TPR) repeat protein